MKNLHLVSCDMPATFVNDDAFEMLRSLFIGLVEDMPRPATEKQLSRFRQMTRETIESNHLALCAVSEHNLSRAIIDWFGAGAGAGQFSMDDSRAHNWKMAQAQAYNILMEWKDTKRQSEIERTYNARYVSFIPTMAKFSESRNDDLKYQQDVETAEWDDKAQNKFARKVFFMPAPGEPEFVIMKATVPGCSFDAIVKGRDKRECYNTMMRFTREISRNVSAADLRNPYITVPATIGIPRSGNTLWIKENNRTGIKPVKAVRDYDEE